MGNDYTTDLIVRDARGEDIAARAEAFNTTYLRLFDAFIRLYDGQYPIMGNAQVMTAKVAWDNACYWAITALLVLPAAAAPAGVHGVDRSADAAFLRPARAHAAVPSRLVSRGRPAHVYARASPNVVDVDCLRALQAAPRRLHRRRRRRCGGGWSDNYALLEAFARTWQAHCARAPPGASPLRLARRRRRCRAACDISRPSTLPIGPVAGPEARSQDPDGMLCRGVGLSASRSRLLSDQTARITIAESLPPKPERRRDGAARRAARAPRWRRRRRRSRRRSRRDESSAESRRARRSAPRPPLRPRRRRRGSGRSST